MANYKKNLRLVQEHLSEGEEIKSSVYGAYESQVLGTDSVRNGILAATERRVIFYAKKMMGYDFESFPLENISSIEKGKGMMGHSISIFASGNKAKMKWINKGDVKGFASYIESMIGKNNSPHQASQTASQPDIPDQIKKLAVLKEQGILSEEEFTQKKTELLGKM